MNQRYRSRASRRQALCSASGSSGCASSWLTLRGQRAPLDHDDQRHAGEQDDDGGAHQHVRPERHQRFREQAPDHRADRAARADDREQALALFVGVDVRGQRPELGHDRVAEHAHPQEERQADRHVGLRQYREDGEVRDEEQEDDREQLHPPDPARELAVQMHDPDHQHRLAGARVQLHLRAALKQDQRLANRLEQVVGGEEQERRHRHHPGGRGLLGMDLGERPKDGGERVLKPLHQRASSREQTRKAAGRVRLGSFR